MGALGFVLACMAIWHTTTLHEFELALSFCSDPSSLVFYHIYCILMVGSSRIGLMLMDFEALPRLCSLRSVTTGLWTEVGS